MARSRSKNVFSHSRLATFEDCPKRFEYRYVLKIPAESEGIEAFVGKRVHEVLERLYLAAGRGQVPSLAKVLHRYDRLFEESYDAARIRIVRKDTPLEFYRSYGRRCLSDYYRRHYPFDADETIAVEHHVLFALDDGSEPAGIARYRLQGIIDRLVRARDGTIEIHDYKTAKRMPTAEQIEKDRQLALYQIGLTERYPDEPIRLVWHFLSRDRIYTSTRSPEQLETLRQETIGSIDRVRAATQFEPRRSGLCDWCEYNDRCPIYPKRRRSGEAAGTEPDPPPGQLQLL
jgi:putative RecB family exonuclease